MVGLRPPRRPCPTLRRHASRRGLTLVEVLLAMSLIVVLASLTWPALTRPLALQRLRKAADQVRADWTRARVKAMSSGRTYVFQYSSDTDRYSVQPLTTGDTASEDALLGGGELGAPATGQETGTVNQRVLPEGITFYCDPAEQQDPSALTGTIPGLDASGGGAILDGASPTSEVRFLPDGTTSTARVVLKNEHGRSIELSLRGLTGVVTVGEVQAGATPAGEAPAGQSAEVKPP